MYEQKPSMSLHRENKFATTEKAPVSSFGQKIVP